MMLYSILCKHAAKCSLVLWQIAGVSCRREEAQCEPSLFPCNTGGECLPRDSVCDNITDCDDGRWVSLSSLSSVFPRWYLNVKAMHNSSCQETNTCRIISVTRLRHSARMWVPPGWRQTSLMPTSLGLPRDWCTSRIMACGALCATLTLRKLMPRCLLDHTFLWLSYSNFSYNLIEIIVTFIQFLE